MDNIEVIKKCPFCGFWRPTILEGIISIDAKRFDKATKICCEKCGAQIIKHTTDEAVEAWNKRTQPAEPVETLVSLIVDALTVAAAEWETSHPRDAKTAKTLKQHIKNSVAFFSAKQEANDER